MASVIYITIFSLCLCPSRQALIKGTLILPQHNFGDIFELTWELLLERDQHIATTAAVAFILSAMKCPERAIEIFEQELHHEEPSRRLNAINKFYVIWRARYQCWPRLEEGAHLYLKIPPPAIEFTLPSPKIALDSAPIIDSAFVPQIKSKVEEVTISQDPAIQRSFVAAVRVCLARAR